jgi:hypothetical protein
VPQSLTPDQRTQIEEFLFRGEKINAIKAYREATGEQLKESKDAVDALERELRELTPDRFTAPKASGCLGALVLATAGLVAAGLVAAAGAALAGS